MTEHPHSVEALRTILKALRTKIETLEAMPEVTHGRLSKARSDNLEKAKFHEAVILSKLAKAGIKL